MKKILSILTASVMLISCGEKTDTEKTSDQESNSKTQQETKEMTTSEASADSTYLEENAKKDGVITTQSGLQYRVITAGTGATPTMEDVVSAHYAGRLIDGTEFDSSYKRDEPIEFPVGRVIPGWVEALQLMKVGDKWELTIPAELGYGDQGAGEDIPGGATLIFEMELLKVTSYEDLLAAHIKRQTDFLDENAKKDGVKITESGLQYKVINAGEGKSPEPESMVTVHYAGRLISGEEFDSSYSRGAPASFPANRLIQGWIEALQMMVEGDKWELTIPAAIAYGEAGSPPKIPPHATLVFDIELISVDN